jgi:hypothetical protein
MNEYLERKLKNRDYFDKPSTTVFEKEPFIKCYNLEGGHPNEVFVTFKLGAIAKLSNGDYDIVYAGDASDGCSFFGAQSPTRKKYVFEIDGYRCKNVPELLEYAKTLEGSQFNLVQDEVEFMDI